MIDQNPTPLTRVFKIGATGVAEDPSMSVMTNEQACNLLKMRYPEIADATLREQPHLISGTARIPRPKLIEAVTEIVAYTGRCAATGRSLESLTPVPILPLSTGEFGL